MAKVLIADDRETNRQLLTTLLRYKNHEVIEAVDGAEALALAIVHRPDLIITDILMPIVDGYEFLRRLRNNPLFEETPVLVYTSTYIEEEARALAVRCGVFRVLIRPVEPAEFLDVVAQALASHGAYTPVESDHSFEAEHRRLLTDKLAEKVAELEAEITRREESEARLATALSAYGQRVFDWEIEKNMPRMTGPGAESIHTAPTHECYLAHRNSIHPDDLAGFDAAIAPAQASVPEVWTQYRCVVEGSERVSEFRGSFHFDSGGRAIRLLGTVLDVTHRTELENERRLLAALVENSLDFIAAATPEGFVTFINPAGQRLISVDKANAILGETIGEHIHPNSLDLLHHQVLPTLRERGEWRGEMEVADQVTGAPIICDFSCFSIFDREGKVAAIAAIARDIRGRKEQELQLSTRLAQLTALRRIDIAISGAVDLQLTLQIVSNEVLAIEAVQAVNLYTYDPHLRELDLACGNGFADRNDARRIAEKAVPIRKGMRERNPAGFEAGTTLFALPLLAKGAVKGVLVVVYRIAESQEENLTGFIETIGSQASIAIESSMLFEDLQRSKNEVSVAYDQTLEGWSRALDLRDKETEGHSRRVTDLTMRIARELRISSEELQHIRRGALLHDIGKVGVPDSILLKPGPLNDEEMAIMRKHTDYALELLAPIAFLHRALDIPYCHHERWDGTGYPRGLKGTQIPLPARIFALADVWDALSSDRPYRKGWPLEKVVEYIRNGSGTHFDPDVVSVFLDVVAR